MYDKLMIVAHPDDESLWGGAQLIMSNGWKVVCCTNGNNPVRRAEFEAVMEQTKSDFEMWNYGDSQFVPLNEVPLKADLERVFFSQQWSKIVTHNAVGEYGHLHHVQIHNLVKQITPEFWSFAFGGSYLSDEIWQKKLHLIGLHKSQKNICDEHAVGVRGEKLIKERVILFL
jgi:LmbE family N-acetylglucosaminyl deacetylase